ncbi:diguanylate cyclase [Patulibacter sp.]|uniref:diguanylate cyclase n=1 Tax=Patulibacter sp. TaxID=1912859 RepID=UPI0027205BED|nr:diguanylate cyclase [Patulibacter sp.]MDO9410206.1 diguanylate cyclase [Patulibacter sp.]
MTSIEPAPADGRALAEAVQDPSRLEVVQRLGLLDGAPDESFDRLTRMATRLTGAPVSLAVLVDDDRQFFVSQVGLPEAAAVARETPLSHSFCQHVVARSSPFLVPDARADPRVSDNLAIRDLDVVAYAGVPLVVEGETVGSFCLIDNAAHEWTAEEMEVLHDLAGMAMTEMSLRLSVAEERLHLREQEALRAVATLVAGEAPPGAVFAAAAEHVAHVFSAAVSRVVRLEPDDEHRLVGAWTRDTVMVEGVGELVELDERSAIGSVLKGRRATGIRRPEPDVAGSSVLRSGMAAPITVDGRFWGGISVGWDVEVPVDERELDRLTRFADLVSLAVTGAQAREQLSQLAFTDHLTGLYNQRAFSERLEEEVRRCRRYGRPLSLVVFDLDHFKLVNDTHGHEAGNRVLAEFASRLVAMRRGSDVVARVGGEEFAWMLPETGGKAAINAAERARALIADTPFLGIGRLTTSIGICSLEDASDAQELSRHADLALYWAKAAGRNTAVRYSPELIALQPGSDSADRLESAKTLAAIRALAGAVDAKDPSTQRHSERVAQLAGELAGVAGWDASRIVLLHSAALVHDVGKIGVPDTILLKPGHLTDEEYATVKSHAALGAEIVADLLSREQVQWIRHHHERHDGRGYPDGVSGADFSEGARLLAVADAWDAMTVARPYGSPRPIPEAIEEMKRGMGGQFAPDAVHALLLLYESGALGARRPVTGD